jgi:hypothetical protein
LIWLEKEQAAPNAVWDQRSLQWRNLARAAITIAVILVFTFLADDDRDTGGWLLVLGLVAVALVAGVLLVRRLR